MKLHAIRSLLCEDHALNIPPRVKTINWFVGKRCNYDCSYCSPHVHDAVSPWLALDQALKFVNTIQQHCLDNGNKIKWIFTGGEPFIDPGFLSLLEAVGTCKTNYQINVVTNGSLPASTYQRAGTWLKGITFSLHLERTEKEIESTMAKLIWLKIHTNLDLNVNVMLLPGKMEQVSNIIDQLKHHGIKFIVRKITPPEIATPFRPYQGAGRKDAELLPKNQQVEHKMIWKKINDQGRYENTRDYYSQQEHDFLSKHNTTPTWINMGAWSDTGYTELNSDQLISQQANHFKDWICYAGVDSIYVDFDGSVYRAQCQNDGPIGHISDVVHFAEQPTVCQLNWCACNTDIPLRKARDLDWVRMIDGQP